MKNKRNKGFTLIELIVVMAIIAILVLLAMPMFMGYTQKAKVTRIINDIKVTENSAELYYMEHGDWPKQTTEYTAAQIKNNVNKFYGRTGQEIVLDPAGKYYQVNFANLNSEMKIPENYKKFVIQNPVGDVYYIGELTPAGITIGAFGPPTENYFSGPGVIVTPPETTEPTEPTEPVVVVANDIMLTATKNTISLGETIQITATVLPVDATNKTVTWTSSNESVATVNSSGLVTSVGPGVSIITATIGQVNKTISMAINVLAENINVTSSNTNLSIGGTTQLQVVFTPANTTETNVTWSSSNEAVATVNNTGLVTAVSGGTAIITAETDNGKTATVGINISSTLSASIGNKLVAGYYSNFVITETGDVWAWGENAQGQLGVGDTAIKSVPTKVNISNVAQLKTVSAHVIALKTNGEVWAWGDNFEGQLGNGTYNDSLVPIQVPITNVIQVEGGYATSYALKSDGTVWAWGKNQYGELGIGAAGTPYNNPTPGQVNTLNDVKAIRAGYNHVMALRADNTIWSWGRNNKGQIGYGGASTSVNAPVQSLDIVNVVKFDTYANHNIALDNNGMVWMWGDNASSQIANGTGTSYVTRPKQMTTITNVIDFSAGDIHTMIIKTDNKLYAWGGNTDGQLGNNTKTQSLSPQEIMSNVVSISASFQNSMAITSDGKLWIWGGGSYGNLGNNTITAIQRLTPMILIE